LSDAYRYDPFGVNLDTQGTSVNPYQFQGRLLEPTSGQYDFGARQYDPAIAAFTSLDSVMGQAQNPLSLNRYLYTMANPESMIDRDGHIPNKHDAEQPLERAVDDAKAALDAAKMAMDEARREYESAVADARAAADDLDDPCPLSPCGEAEARKWHRSKLEAHASAGGSTRIGQRPLAHLRRHVSRGC
jgi:RHS repeat-associated protein